MRFAIAFASVMLAMTAQAHALDVRVETFRRVCIESRHSFLAGEIVALREGWTPVREDVRAELQQVFAVARSADTPATPIRRLQAYASSEFPDVSVVLSEMTVQGRLINGCYLYDFAAVEALSPDVFVGIVGSQPTEAHNLPDVIIMQKWVAPASLPNVATLRAGYVPRGSEVGAQVGIVGLALAITSFSQETQQ